MKLILNTERGSFPCQGTVESARGGPRYDRDGWTVCISPHAARRAGCPESFWVPRAALRGHPQQGGPLELDCT